MKEETKAILTADLKRLPTMLSIKVAKELTKSIMLLRERRRLEPIKHFNFESWLLCLANSKINNELKMMKRCRRRTEQ